MTIGQGKPRAGSASPLAAVSWAAAIVSLAVLGLFLLYMRGNDSNHTGFEPWLLSICFLPTAILGTALLLRGNRRWGAILACCVGLGGLAFLFYIDHFNIMVEYDRWGNRGLPEPGEAR